MKPRLRFSLKRSFPRAAACAAGATVRRRRAKIVITLVARGHGVDARLRRGAAEVEALRGDVAVELVKCGKRRRLDLGQLRLKKQARRVILCGLGLAVEELVENRSLPVGRLAGSQEGRERGLGRHQGAPCAGGGASRPEWEGEGRMAYMPEVRNGLAEQAGEEAGSLKGGAAIGLVTS